MNFELIACLRGIGIMISINEPMSISVRIKTCMTLVPISFQDEQMYSHIEDTGSVRS